MPSKYWIILVLCHKFLRIEAEDNWLDLFIQQLKNGENVYQVTVFKNDVHFTSDYNELNFFRELAKNFPTVISNLANKTRANSDRSLSLKVHENPRAARVLYLVLEKHLDNEADLNRLFRTFDTFVKLAPIPTRPKTVLLFKSNEVNESIYKKIFEYTWSLKFLDFLILQVESETSSKYIDYDPFTGKIWERHSTKSSDPLFFNKLRNINRYPIKLPDDSLVKREFDEYLKTGLTKQTFPAAKVVAHFAKSINASVEYITMKRSTLQNFINNELTVYPAPHLSTSAYNKTIVTSRYFNSEHVVFIVPEQLVSQIDVPSSLLTNFQSFCALTILVIVVVKVFKLPKENWSVKKIVSALVGCSFPKPPQHPIEKIVVFAVVSFSMINSITFLADLSSIRFDEIYKSFETVEDIRKSGFTVIVDEFMDERLLDDQFKTLMAGSLKREGPEMGCGYGSSLESTICVTVKYLAEHRLLKSQVFPPENPVNAKLVIPNVFMDFYAYPLEKASPYLYAFDSVLRKHVEAGITIDLITAMKREESFDFPRKPPIEPKILQFVGLIVGCGYFLSVLILFMEIAVSRISCYLRNQL